MAFLYFYLYFRNTCTVLHRLPIWLRTWHYTIWVGQHTSIIITQCNRVDFSGMWNGICRKLTLDQCQFLKKSLQRRNKTAGAQNYVLFSCTRRSYSNIQIIIKILPIMFCMTVHLRLSFILIKLLDRYSH